MSRMCRGTLTATIHWMLVSILCPPSKSSFGTTVVSPGVLLLHRLRRSLLRLSVDFDYDACHDRVDIDHERDPSGKIVDYQNGERPAFFQPW